MKLLGSLLPMSKIGPQAEFAATRFLERWDVPHEIDGRPVAEDVDDRTPHFWRDRFGKRLAGQASPNTLIYGAPSMATPVVIGLIPLLAMLTAILAALIGPTPALALGGLAIGAVTASLVIAEGWAMALGCALVGAVIPISATVGMAAFHLHFNVNVNAIGNSMIVTALVVAGGIFMLAMLLTGSIDRARVALVYLLGFGLVLGAVRVFANFLPDWMAPGVWFFLGAGLPWVWTHLSWKSYHDRLFVQDVKASAESVGQSGASHVLARRQQAENVMRDKSPVLTLGTATGTFTAQGDGFAPDKGKKLCMSVKDSSMNVAVFGRLGTRKSSFFRAWISQWVKEKIGGFLVLDEKDLPAELRGLVGYTLIEPGVKYAPLQGLNPTETAVAIFGAGKAAEKDDASSFFYVSAYTMWLQGAVIVQALMDVEREKMKAAKLAELNDEPLSAAIAEELEQARRIRWTFSSIRTVIAHGIRGDQAITGILNSLSEHRRENEGEQFMLEAAIDYWRTTIPGMDAETKANVFATLLKKIDPLVSHRDLVAFAHTETSVGFDLADILTGGGYGVNLPEATYGMGGLVLANLAKERVYKLLRERGSHWEKMEGQKRVGIFVDEAAGLVSGTDVGFLKVGRGFGTTCVFAVQNADAYVYKLGSQAAAETFLDNFASMICMESSDYTYQVLNHKLGNVRKQKWKGPSTAVNFVRSMRMLAESALLDPSHPGAKRAETLLRRGAGVFREHSDGAHGFAGHKHYSREPSVVDAVLKIDPIEQVEWVDAPLLERPEWSSYLSARGVAIAQVLRGEVKRRDVIHFESLREFPPELLEQVPAPKVETPSTEETTATADDLHHLNRKSSRHTLFDLDKGDPTAAETMAEATSSLPADKVKP